MAGNVGKRRLGPCEGREWILMNSLCPRPPCLCGTEQVVSFLLSRPHCSYLYDKALTAIFMESWAWDVLINAKLSHGSSHSVGFSKRLLSLFILSFLREPGATSLREVNTAWVKARFFLILKDSKGSVPQKASMKQNKQKVLTSSAYREAVVIARSSSEFV